MADRKDAQVRISYKRDQAAPLSILAVVKLKELAPLVRMDGDGKEPQPVLHFSDGGTLTGEEDILRYLARVSDLSGKTTLYGTDPRSATEVDTLLRLAFGFLGSKEDLPANCESLDAHLLLRTWLVGHAPSIADFATFSALVANKRWPALQKSKDKYVNLQRWFALCSSRPEFQTAQEVTVKRKEEMLAKGHTGSFEIDLPGAEMGKVCTRFPPEPSGYLHIGHAKAALLNNYFARRYGGKLILRFDDTNPQKEKQEYVDNILKDLKTMDIQYDVLTHSSDYFDDIIKYGEQMLKEGKAYCDNTPVEQMRKERGLGIASKCRSNSVQENLRIFKEMQEGSTEGLTYCMRAKIDMEAKNLTLRDPTLFRCSLTPHHKTGTKYKCYPTYDFTCPIVDSVEGVTHTLRTSEYHDRNEQYNWMCDALKIRKPHIWDFSRLNFTYTLLSKRRLQWFVDNKRVEGWYDPRFPTIQGVLRRGMTVEALKDFILEQGASKNMTWMTWDKLWAKNSAVLDERAGRYNAVSVEGRSRVRLTNYPENKVEAVLVPLNPKKKDGEQKSQLRSGLLLVEPFDAGSLAMGEEFTLMGWGNARVTKLTKRPDSGIDVDAELTGGTDFSKTKKLHWVAQGLQTGASPAPAEGKSKSSKKESGKKGPAAAADGGADVGDEDTVAVTLVEYDYLVTKDKLTEEDEKHFEDWVTPTTKFETVAIGEAALRNLQKGDKVQLQRRGFFICDRIFAGPRQPLVLLAIPSGKQSSMSGIPSKVPVRAAPAAAAAGKDKQ